MLVKKWERLPLEMQIDAVRPYYEMLRKKNFSLFFKRVFDIFISFISKECQMFCCHCFC